MASSNEHRNLLGYTDFIKGLRKMDLGMLIHKNNNKKYQ
jgi:hypothetical protein